MLYIDYIILKEAYEESDKRVNDLVDMREAEFVKVMPNAIQYDAVRVIKSVSPSSALDNYVIQVERIDRMIRQAKIIRSERKEQLEAKKAELKESADVDDRIFYLRSIKKMTVEEIAKLMNYSEGNIYYHRAKIRHELKKNGIIPDDRKHIRFL